MGMDIVILGLTITSSWGNGHATTYRALVRALSERGHRTLFLERNAPWYENNRDAEALPYCRIALYSGLEELKEGFGSSIREADLVILGSYVPEGIAVGRWITQHAEGIKAFYDIDTPVTLSRLERGRCDYIDPELIRSFDLYLSFTGGPVLDYLETVYGARSAVPLYCSVDPDLYHPEPGEPSWDLGYLGTYSRDRQDSLRALLMEPAECWPEGRFIVAGPQYPPEISWPDNVRRMDHVPPPEHRRFYNSLRFALNLTRASMIQAGYSPSVRLFEAAACQTAIISDPWEGLDRFLTPGQEVMIAQSPQDILAILRGTPRDTVEEIGRRARKRILSAHTARHRAQELEQYVMTAWEMSGDENREERENRRMSNVECPM